MAERIPGINFTGPVVPNLDSDTYPSHYAKYGKGGWREVATIADRDAISTPRREAGMAVFVASEAKLYILNEDLETWSEFKSGSTDSIRKTDNFDTFEPLFDGEIVQYIGEDESDYESYVQGYFYKTTLMEESGEDPYYVYTQIDVQPATDLVWGNIEGDITNQEDLNTELTSLQDQIDILKSRGRYLTLWNASTGLAESDPPTSPYVYQAGDYFIVGTVAASGGTNYRPDGTSYTTGTASTIVETEELAVDDTYYFDGSTWHLQKNTQKTLTFANIAGDPYENTNLATALDAKADVSSIGDATLTITKSGVAVGSFSANATEDVTLDVDTDILPTQTGNEGKFLKTDGSHASWQEVKPIVWVSYVDE